MLYMTKIIILTVGWPVLVAGSIYLFTQGRKVYRMVEGSLVGKITKVLVISMLAQMYCLGAITTVYMLENIDKAVYWGLAVFGVWFVVFVWSLSAIKSAQKEIGGLSPEPKEE